MDHLGSPCNVFVWLEITVDVQPIGHWLDWMLVVKDTQAMRSALDMHVTRFQAFYTAFKRSGAPEAQDDE